MSDRLASTAKKTLIKPPKPGTPNPKGEVVNRILVLTTDPKEATALKAVLTRATESRFHVEWTRRLAIGLKRLRLSQIDAIVVNLSLADSSGIATFDKLLAAAPDMPIKILSDLGDALTIEAMRRGAQGCFSKGHFHLGIVPDTLCNTIQRKAVERALHKEKARAEIVLNSINDAVIVTDMAGNVDYLNSSAENITGWSREEARGRPIDEVFRIINGITREPSLSPAAFVLQSNEAMGLEADTILVRRDGTEAAIEDSAAPVHDASGKLAGTVIVFHDVSAAHAMTKKMAHVAKHDFLTDLPNRSLLNDRIAQAIRLAKRSGTQFALLFLDLDNFKHINDSLGHETGDALLQSVTQRLKKCVRGVDTVSRQGGDEFVILLADSKQEKAALIARKIMEAMTLPHSIDGRDLNITTSIGISIYPGDGEEAETLIKNADTAMYQAKESGRNDYRYFSSDMNVRAVERQKIEAALRLGLERQEFLLHYQPVVNLDTGLITGAEALIRWRHPEWGMVHPEKFVPIAEDCGLIVPIGRWVLREACTQGQRWREAGLPPISMAVNLSSVEFGQEDLLKTVRAVLKDTDMDPRSLQLELTEGVLMHDTGPGAAMLTDLKRLGVQLALDDFGTGYSSLSYLKQFPIDTLKIDQSFVRDIASPKEEGIIVSAVIAMGNSLKKRVIAEGVETPSQLEFLTDRNCEEGQGYLFSRPVDADAFGLLLRRGVPGVPAILPGGAMAGEANFRGQAFRAGGESPTPPA